MSLVRLWAHSPLVLLGTHLHVTIKVLMSKLSVTNRVPCFEAGKAGQMEALFEVIVTLFIITRDKWKDMTAHSLYRKQWKHEEASIWKTTVEDLKWSLLLLETRTEANNIQWAIASIQKSFMKDYNLGQVVSVEICR